MLLRVASVWEMQIKAQLGRLTLDAPLADVVRSQQDVNELEVVPVTLEHVLVLESLPAHHKDPFDRLLIAQAITEDAVLLSRDALFANYGIDVRW